MGHHYVPSRYLAGFTRDDRLNVLLLQDRRVERDQLGQAIDA